MAMFSAINYESLVFVNFFRQCEIPISWGSGYRHGTGYEFGPLSDVGQRADHELANCFACRAYPC
jgi:hypothetical protein